MMSGVNLHIALPYGLAIRATTRLFFWGALILGVGMAVISTYVICVSMVMYAKSGIACATYIHGYVSVASSAHRAISSRHPGARRTPCCSLCVPCPASPPHTSPIGRCCSCGSTTCDCGRQSSGVGCDLCTGDGQRGGVGCDLCMGDSHFGNFGGEHCEDQQQLDAGDREWSGGSCGCR